MADAEFIQLPGTTRSVPYVTVLTSYNSCWCRIDTGADVTVLPEAMLKRFTRNEHRVPIRAYNGEVKRRTTYCGWIQIGIKNIYLKQVLKTDAATGFLGMDVIKHFSLLVAGAEVILE